MNVYIVIRSVEDSGYEDSWTNDSPIAVYYEGGPAQQHADMATNFWADDANYPPRQGIFSHRPAIFNPFDPTVGVYYKPTDIKYTVVEMPMVPHPDAYLEAVPCPPNPIAREHLEGT